MKTEKTVKRFSSTMDCPELRRGARDLGHFLGTNQVHDFAEFRAKVSGLQDEASAFVLGYRSAALDIVAAYSEYLEGR